MLKVGEVTTSLHPKNFILFDVTDVNVQIDDEIIVLGNSMDGNLNISVSDIAKWNKTIEWEILTNMSKRLERVEVE